jgi:hypothetical protein
MHSGLGMGKDADLRGPIVGARRRQAPEHVFSAAVVYAVTGGLSNQASPLGQTCITIKDGGRRRG